MARKPSWGNDPYCLHHSDGTATFHFLKGRQRWALERLLGAGAAGCTPITEPGPRWSAYVFELRAAGFIIETIYEPHGGPFAGTHGRYVLPSHVTRSAGALA